MAAPIKPATVLNKRGKAYNEAVNLINECIQYNKWHLQYFPKEGYRAVLLHLDMPEVMDIVVDDFREAGWDCKWSSAYDARGPHNCFYVSEKHFEGNE